MFVVKSMIQSILWQMRLYIKTSVMALTLLVLIGGLFPLLVVHADDGVTVPGQVTNRYLASKASSYADLTVPEHHDAPAAKELQAAGLVGGGLLVGDDFGGANLATAHWALVDPLGNGAVALRAGQLLLTVPAGASHDPWNFNRAPRIMQPMGNGDLALEVKFASLPTLAYQMQGLVVEQDQYNWLRFDVQHDGQALYALAIATIDGVSVVKNVTALVATNGIWLRVNRQADQWDFSYSADGQTWQNAATFAHMLTVSAVGPYAANHGDESPAPGFTAQVDYVRNLATGSAAGAVAGPDIQAPMVHGVHSIATEQGLTIRWRTDEPSNGVVEYGATEAYGASIVATGDGYTHEATLTGLTAEQRYHYRIIAHDTAANATTSADAYLLFTPSATDSPTINVWYGNQQSFGQKGRPQTWANILGNVADPDGVTSLRYTLNNGPSMKLSIGPDGRRLERAGDFNVDLAIANLQTGVNTVVIIARDSLSNTTMQTVTLNYQPTVNQPPYSINWSTLGGNNTQIQSVAHSIDGKWGLENNKVRTLEPGYDRMLGLGDIGWNDYEVLAPLTIHSLPANDFGVGVILRWTGNTDVPRTCSQPKCGWLPLGVFARYNGSGLQLYVDGDTILNSQRFTLTVGSTYWFKVRVETDPSGGIYSMKVWEDGQSEPTEWNVSGQSTLTKPQRGAISFAIHEADVSIGNITVSPVGLSDPPLNFPPTANNDSAAVAPGSTVYVNVLKNDTDAGGLLVPSSIQIENQPQNGTVTVDTTTGQIRYIHNGSATTNDSFTYTVADDGTGGGANILRSQKATVSINVTTEVPSTVISDDFSRCLLNPVWSFVNPLGEGAFELVGAGTDNAHLLFKLPAGVAHNAWASNGANDAIRLMQNVTNSDFEVEVSFTTEPTGNTNDQGILIEQDGANFIRFDAFFDVGDGVLKAFVGTTLNGVNQVVRRPTIVAGTGMKLRVNRTGNTWIMSHWDGTQWKEITTFDQVLTVTKVGVYAANAGGAVYETGVDYLFDTADPITPEDGSRNTLTVVTQGNGAVNRNPDSATYACGALVELTAQPGNGAEFAFWSGALTGNTNPNTVEIEGPTTVTATFVLSGTDVTPPVITLNGNNPLVLSVGATYQDPGATAEDDKDGTITNRIVVGGDVVNTAQIGSYTVTYDVTDTAGNRAVQKKRVVLVTAPDTVPPVITLNGATPFQLEAGTRWQDPGATAQDNVDGNISNRIVIGGDRVMTNTLGTYTVTYDVTDASGNPAVQKKRVVNVVDTTPPVITLNGNNPLQLTVGTTYTDPGATATDSVDGNLTSKIVVGGDTVNTAIADTYVVTYNVSDTSGNKAAQQTRTVTVTMAAPTSFKVFMPLVKK